MPDGRMLTTLTDQPPIMIHGPGDRLLIIQRPVAAIAFDPAERRGVQAIADFGLACGRIIPVRRRWSRQRNL